MNFTISTDIEKDIKDCRDFYNQHLNDVKNRDQALKDLNTAISIRESNPAETVFSRLSNVNAGKEQQIQDLLAKHFPEGLLNLYNQKVEVTIDISKSRMSKTKSDSFWVTVGAAFLDNIEEQNARAKAQSNHELELLKYTHFCLTNFGLHPKIKDRDPKKHKKYNLLIKHKAHSRTIIEEYQIGLSFDKLESTFTQYFRNRKSIQLNGKIIPHAKIVEVKITTTLLGEGELELFFKSKKIKWGSFEENEINFLHACLDETNRYLPHPDEKIVSTKKSGDFHETQVALVNYPSALSLFNKALQKRNDESLSRNCLDDLRLCLEIFLKEKLKNKKSLENQVAALGQYLKTKGENNQVTELLHKVLDFYSKFQNENVKHNDNVKKRDVNFILKLTSSLIEHLSAI